MIRYYFNNFIMGQQCCGGIAENDRLNEVVKLEDHFDLRQMKLETWMDHLTKCGETKPQVFQYMQDKKIDKLEDHSILKQIFTNVTETFTATVEGK